MYFNGYEVELQKTEYMNNNRLAVQMNCFSNYGKEPYGMLTVNLPEEEISDEFCAFINFNTIYCLPNEIEDFLVKNNIAIPTGNYAVSGYCLYPEFRFNMERFINGKIK